MPVAFLVLIESSFYELLKCLIRGFIVLIELSITGNTAYIRSRYLEDHLKEALIILFELFNGQFIGISALGAELDPVPGQVSYKNISIHVYILSCK